MSERKDVPDTPVFWRGSTSDLATDLKAILTVKQVRALRTELAAKVLGGHGISELIADVKELLGGEGDWWNAFRYELGKEPQPPVPMLLWCPECNERHVDRGEFATKAHHTHACQFCGHVWRPAVAPTMGVQFLPGFGPEARKPASAEAGKLGSSESQKPESAAVASLMKAWLTGQGGCPWCSTDRPPVLAHELPGWLCPCCDFLYRKPGEQR